MARKQQMKKEDSQNIENQNTRTIKAFFQAFMSKNPAQLTKFLADDATYEIPGPISSVFTKSIKGKKAIHEFTKKLQQTKNEFIHNASIKPKFTVAKNLAIVEWTMSGIDKLEKKSFSSSGLHKIQFDSDGKIKSIRIFINAPLSPQVHALDEDRLLVSDQGKLALMAWAVV